MARQKPTISDDFVLSQQQQTAVDLLVTGKTVTDTAEAIEVARQTVSEWLNHHAGFQAALNRRRQELWAEMTDGLRNLVPTAIEVLKGAMEGENPSLMAAIYVLKAAGLYRMPVPDGETDAEEIAIEQQRATEAKMLKSIMLCSPLPK